MGFDGLYNMCLLRHVQHTVSSCDVMTYYEFVFEVWLSSKILAYNMMQFKLSLQTENLVILGNKIYCDLTKALIQLRTLN